MYRTRVDSNQTEIVRKIRSVPGWRWLAIPNDMTASSRRRGDGLFRTALMLPGHWIMLEIKTAKGGLRPHQVESVWNGSIVVVRSFDDILRLVKQPASR